MAKPLSVLILLLVLQLDRYILGANAQGVTVEGRRFKDRIEQVFDNQPVTELVFVLDSSGSVSQSDFYVAVEFIKVASTLISVSASTTRVSVISYSSCDSIHTRIDYIGSPVGKNKCTFNQDLNRVVYHAGATCTADALLSGHNVINTGRVGAQRVLMLLTDGASNDGGSPHVNAVNLKNDGVKIFAIGIGNINEDELNDIATNVNEYVFILANFGDITKLGIVVRQDIKDLDAYFDTVNEAQCNSLCNGGPNCCDNRAVCACATRSGSTLCACEAGYTGTGFSCQVCQIGTYKSDYGDGPCTPCPLDSTTNSTQSRSRSDCHCINGYEGNPCDVGGTCQSIRCPDLNIANINGVIMDECDTTFGTTCQFYCRDQYRPIAGDENITCLATEQWLGTPLQCEKITCGLLRSNPNNAVRTCNTVDRSISTVCELSCDPGYEFKPGVVTNVTCQSTSEISAHWSVEDDEDDPCKKVSCSVLSVNHPMFVRPGLCLEIPKFNQVCTYVCKPGYQAVGNTDSVTCMADGTWSLPAVDITCRDIEPPRLDCPPDINNPTDEFMPTSTINRWEAPVAQDNTGIPVKLVGTHSHPYRFEIGTTVVTYSGTDMAGNVENCTFNVTVRDEERPRLTNCTGDINFQTLGLNDTGDLGIGDEDWNTSDFDDNSGMVNVDTLGVPSGSRFPLGETIVVARATDPSNNTNECTVSVSVSNYACQYYPPPLNGGVACVNGASGQLCRVSCRLGGRKQRYHFTGQPETEIYACIADGNGQHSWAGYDGTDTYLAIKMPWPDCAKGKSATGVKVKTGFRYRNMPCLNTGSQDDIRVNFIGVLDHLKISTCDQPVTQCTFENVVVQCGQTQRRKKRQVIEGSGGFDVVEITFTLLLEMSETAGPDFNVLDYLTSAVNSVQDSVANGNVTISVDGVELALNNPIIVESEYTILCDVGHVPLNESCVPCAPGTFMGSGVCERCPVGTYQDQYGNTTCTSCPVGSSTAAPGARTQSKCRALCRPGTYSKTGVESCNACPVGTYEPGRGSTLCSSCPDGLTTWTTGNTDVANCTDICSRGLFSPTGFAPCLTCPKGTYQPLPQRKSCTPCPEDLFTHREGAHAIEYCQVINECESNPCADGATCVDITHGYDCVCPPGFTGDDCELDIDECFGNDVCLNNATCINMFNAYVCECANGFRGENCQINIDDCLSADCRFGSTCVDGIASYTCACAEGFAGEHCEINLYDCASNPCRNGASCIDLKSNFSCCCAPGYTGRLCELISDHCQSSPCHGGATCTSTRNSYTCSCPPGFRGRNCEVNINECLEPAAYCQNGGTCQDLINGYQCNCPLGFNGDHCQTELPRNFDLSYQSPPRTADRVELEGVLPDLYELTLAFWMKTSDTTNFGTPISYATRGVDGASDVDNTLTLQDYNSFVFYVNGQSAFTYTRANGDTNWHFISVTWTSETGAWSFYLDGAQAESGSGLSTGSFVKGRGMFIVGQEQDTYNGSYVVKESFIGSLSQVNIWDYAMTQNEIQSLQACCSHSGNALSWAQLSTGLRGALRRSTRSDICNSPSCQNRGNCRDIECERGGVCAVQKGQAVCRCPAGFTGRRCQFDINECSVNNGGCSHQCSNTPGSFVCSCRQGYALQPDQKTCNSVSFCKHNGKFHSAVDSWEEGCNACACHDGRAVCSPKPCPRLECQELETEVILPGDCCPVCLAEMKTCSVSNDGNYQTFDMYSFDQRGECRYLLTRDYSGTSNFEVHMEHQFLNASQNLLAVAVYIYIDCVEVKVDIDGRVYVQDEAVALPYAHRQPANVRIEHVGDDVEVFSNKGLTVTWSQTAGVRVDLTTTHGSDVQGLCGNMNGNKKDDKMTRHGITTSKSKELVHSWKIEGYKYCKKRNTRPMKFGYLKVGSCSTLSYRDFGLAFKKCRVFFKKAFKRCVSEVDPKQYITDCIEDTCTCGVRQPCHCEAISSYVNECRRQLGVDVKDWRRISACALQCPPTMQYDECGPTCHATCEDPEGRRCPRITACVAGCQCLAGQVFHNGACISRSQC